MLGRFSKILLVEDSNVERKIIRAFLTKMGFENIDEARDGREALVLLRANCYRLVLSDWDMAPMNGVELLRTMRIDARWARIPFILVTARSQHKYVDLARDEGATHYLPKPFTADALADRIARV